MILNEKRHNRATIYRHLVLFLIMLFTFGTTSAQTKRALVVGISEYQKVGENSWATIHGANDAALITPVLKKQGYKVTKICNKDATANRIRKELKTLVSSCKRGDIVYLHFSCHGQPFEDFNGDEEDGWDESIVPVDAYKLYKKGTYEGQKHLTDDLLNKYIKKLREKIGPTGFLYVVIDACHAGTSSRANDETARGTHVGFTYNNKVFKPSASKKSHYRIEASSKQANILFIEACRPDQVNTEIKVDGKRFGPLSYNIAQALSGFTLTTNANDFVESIKRTMMNTGRWPNNQNLVIETSY